MKNRIMLCLALMCACVAVAQHDDTIKNSTLEALTVSSRASAGVSRMGGAVNGQEIGQGELFRAACCNLGESFVANPSVDVNYNDAAVGARQIRLLGLSGTYVQMLAEGLPMSVGATMPYLLGYVPGAWMKSLSVSKGAASVKNGPQSITGQISVEYLKPEDEQGWQLNLYGDSRWKAEGNVVGNVHLNKDLSTMVLAHYEHDFAHHDEDGDGWHDSPNVRQLHVMNRWKYQHGRYIMHAGLGVVNEEREGGQLLSASDDPFRVLVSNRRAEAYMKHAYLLNQAHNTNVALMASGSLFHLDGTFGRRTYDDKQLNFNSQLILEHDFTESHMLSAGVSFAADAYDEQLLLGTQASTAMNEYTPGVYAQYTFNPSYHLTVMAGLRADHSSLYGSYITPRMHVKVVPADWLTLRASVGKGYRSPHVLAENHYLLASGREIIFDHGQVAQVATSLADSLSLMTFMEEAWNSGMSATFYVPVGDHTVTLGAEYYYTRFLQQLVVDYDTDPLAISIGPLRGPSFSHTAQVDVSFEPSDEWTLMAAFRYNNVQCTYGEQRLEKPLQSRYRALLTAGWKPMMGIWKVDVTLALNGGGRMPKPYATADGTPSWEEEFPAYPTLNVQLTREFRHCSLYVGGENLTGYRQPNPIINVANPWANTFEPTMIWGPVHGAMVYFGLRASL